MGLFKRAKPKPVSMRRRIDPALENRSVDQRKVAYVEDCGFNERLVFDYVPIRVRGERFYLTHVWAPTMANYIEIVAVDADADEHSFDFIDPVTMPDEVLEAFERAGWFA